MEHYRRSNSLGIASLVLGLASLFLMFFACCGGFLVSLPMSGIGLLLAVVGLFSSMSRDGSGVGYSIAGGLTCFLALGLSLLPVMFGVALFGGAARIAENVKTSHENPPAPPKRTDHVPPSAEPAEITPQPEPEKPEPKPDPEADKKAKAEAEAKEARERDRQAAEEKAAREAAAKAKQDKLESEAAVLLRNAKRFLKDAKDPANKNQAERFKTRAKENLQQILKKYPTTKVAKEADKLLADL